MATKVSLVNNILKIEDDVKNKYFNAAWCSICFDDTGVIITDEGKRHDQLDLYYTHIKFEDFQDGGGTSYADESSIATYLSNKIG